MQIPCSSLLCVAGIEHCDQKQFKERWANAGSQFEAHSIVVEKTRHQEPAAASHVVSAVRKQSVMNSGAQLTFSTYTVQDSSLSLIHI